MNFDEIVAQLNDLPSTYKRPGAPYTNFVEAIASALLLYTQASDGLFAQTDFNLAANGWIDVWGSLAGIPRRLNESDTVYKNRIRNMVLSHHATPISIVDWLRIVENVNGSVTENLPAIGYQITLPPTLLVPQIKQIIVDLAYVRPAGVPFKVVQESGNTFLNTVNYLGGAPRVTGAYLAGSVINVNALIGNGTTNAVGLLPDLLFTDPLINPNLPPLPATVSKQETVAIPTQLFTFNCSSPSFVNGGSVLASYRGGSPHFSWYYDPTSLAGFVPTIQANLDLTIAAMEGRYTSLAGFFNTTPVTGQPTPTAQDPSGAKFNFIALGPGTNPGGAFHCPARFGDMYLNEDAAISAKAVMFGALAELVECFAVNFNTTVTTPWAPGNFVGEGLSVALAEELLDANVFGIVSTGQSQTWLNANDPLHANANRHDYSSGSLTGNDGSDTNQFAVGYFLLVLFWLRYHKSFSWAQIVQNGKATPAALCSVLGVSTTTFNTDIQTLLPSGTQYDLKALYPAHPDNPWA